MEVRFMDKMFNTTKIVDAYTSCIWNVEYIGYGDFELYFPMDYTSLTGIEIGGYASIRESDRYMIVEKIVVQTSVEEGNYLIVSGRSLEALLTYRVVREKTILTGKVQDCIMRIVNANAILPANLNRVLDGLSFKTSTDPHVTNLELDFELEVGDNLYDAVYVICEAFNLGFRILPLTEGKMEFELYAGVDHSYSQEANPWIVFSPKFENLKESEMSIDTSSLTNVCITDVAIKRQVVDSGGNVTEVEDVVVIELNEEISGLDRREIYLDKSSGVNIDEIKIEDFGKPTDRFNVRDYMEYVVTSFDRTRYEADLKKYRETYANHMATIEKEKTEWVMQQHTPEWQEQHPNENPYYWESVTTPGDSASDISRKNAYNAAIAAREPKKSDYMTWGWEITDWTGYNDAVKLAQAQINAEFSKAVADAITTSTNAIIEECRSELANNSSISRFVGNVDANVNYIFGRDYGLGDIVQIVNEYDFQAVTRITGMLFGQDTSSGFVMRPTFKSDDEAVFTV